MRFKQDQHGSLHIALLLIIVLVLISGFAIFQVISSNNRSSSNNITTKRVASNKPIIPSTNAYIGAWVNPNGPGTASGNLGETNKLAAFSQRIGKKIDLIHTFFSWNSITSTPSFPQPSLNKMLSLISSNDAMPVINWAPYNYSEIANGSQDNLIIDSALKLKAYNKPVFLRWGWEMNLADRDKFGDSSGFTLAWKHIYDIYRNQGATNVAFVWCPGIGGGLAGFNSWYPGDAYVDWIAVDGYDRSSGGENAFNKLFNEWYQQWGDHLKPLMIAETGALNSKDQAAYINGIKKDLPTLYPHIKALLYFDAVGPAGDWSLDSNGITAFSSLANM